MYHVSYILCSHCVWVLSLIESREVLHPGDLQLFPEQGQFLGLGSGKVLHVLQLNDFSVELCLPLHTVIGLSGYTAQHSSEGSLFSRPGPAHLICFGFVIEAATGALKAMVCRKSVCK